MAKRETAAHPGDITSNGWMSVAKRVFAEMGNDHVGLIAAGCAFYGLLAIFPGVIAIMALAGLFFEPDMVVAQLEGISRFMPAEAAEIVIGQATEVAGSQEGGLGLAAVFGILVAVYSASKAVQALTEGLNVAFEIEETRNIVWLYVHNILLTLGMILAFLGIVAIAAIVPAVLAILPFGQTLETVINLLRWPVLLLFVILGLALIYKVAPDRSGTRWRWITPGAAVATVIWIAGSLAFALYVGNFADYNETFGALGGVIVLLTWLWLSAFIILMGAELDSEMERQAKHDPEGDGLPDHAHPDNDETSKAINSDGS